jgi:hypothetical protein
MLTKFNFLILTLVLFTAGCATETSVLIVGDDESKELQKVEEVFNSIESKEDKLVIHKLFAGGADYLAVCKSLDSTSRFDPILGRVQTSYGWDREKYPELTDAVSDYLVSVGYDEPKELKSEEDRQNFAKIFQDLAGVTEYE